MLGLEFKKDPYLVALACVLVLCGTALVWHGDLTLKEAGGYLAAALLSPGLIGKKKDETP